MTHRFFEFHDGGYIEYHSTIDGFTWAGVAANEVRILFNEACRISKIDNGLEEFIEFTHVVAKIVKKQRGKTTQSRM